MADTAAPSRPRDIPPTGLNLPPPSLQPYRHGLSAYDTLSPVAQNGSFDFDRIIKEGQVSKRTRHTKGWKSIYMVLRPNLLSIYRDKHESKLRHQIRLSDLTAIARQRHPKRKERHVFALFSPARNYHLQAASEEEAEAWVDVIRREARIDEDEDELYLASPGGHPTSYQGFERSMDARITQSPPSFVEYSGAERTSFSDLSDMAGSAPRLSALSLSNTDTRPSTSSMSGINLGLSADEVRRAQFPQEEERVVYHGWIYLLKSKSGVRQWKKVWLVVRPKGLAFYKNEAEYTALLVLSLSNIIDAVEIDPISKSKTFCMQIISEERNYRLCAIDEESLTRCLGALKSLLSKRKA
ncbi:hypothetical protein BDY17DRAFT_241359, partial [Neohortaea acidophila]